MDNAIEMLLFASTVNPEAAQSSANRDFTNSYIEEDSSQTHNIESSHYSPTPHWANQDQKKNEAQGQYVRGIQHFKTWTIAEHPECFDSIRDKFILRNFQDDWLIDFLIFKSVGPEGRLKSSSSTNGFRRAIKSLYKSYGVPMSDSLNDRITSYEPSMLKRKAGEVTSSINNVGSAPKRLAVIPSPSAPRSVSEASPNQNTAALSKVDTNTSFQPSVISSSKFIGSSGLLNPQALSVSTPVAPALTAIPTPQPAIKTAPSPSVFSSIPPPPPPASVLNKQSSSTFDKDYATLPLTHSNTHSSPQPSTTPVSAASLSVSYADFEQIMAQHREKMMVDVKGEERDGEGLLDFKKEENEEGECTYGGGRREEEHYPHHEEDDDNDQNPDVILSLHHSTHHQRHHQLPSLSALKSASTSSSSSSSFSSSSSNSKSSGSHLLDRIPLQLQKQTESFLSQSGQFSASSVPFKTWIWKSRVHSVPQSFVFPQ
jgi:hypothetical protein